MPRFASDNKQRFLRNDTPAASDEWLDEFTSTQKPKNKTGFRPSKFTTADLLRNLKEKKVEPPLPMQQQNNNTNNHDKPGLFSLHTYRNLPPFRDFPLKLKLQLAGVIMVALLLLSMLLGSSSSSSKSNSSYIADLDFFSSTEDNADTNTYGGTNNVDGSTFAAGISSTNSAVPGLVYYNVGNKNADPSSSSLPGPISYHDYPPGGAAIAILVTNRTKDVDELVTGLRSLAFLQGDSDPHHKAPVLCFHEGDLTTHQKTRIAASTDRPVAFPTVDFTEFPDGFDPNKHGDTDFKVKGRKTWGYYQMIRFWVTGIWKHPAIAHFDTIMRIDSDSCFKDVNPYLPNFMNKDLFYHSQYVGFENGAEYVNGLYDFAVQYMRTVKSPSEPRNFLLWHFTTTVWTTMDTLPLFRSNFEVSRKSFMQRKEISDWHDALTEQEPFGVYRHRWGDAVTRFLTASIFVNQDRIMTIRPTGYFHKIGCSKEEVDEALLMLSDSSKDELKI